MTRGALLRCLTMGARILVVDDAPDLLASLTKYLSGEGHAVLSASSCAAAREQLERSAPELCIFDYELPDGTAFDLLKLLAQRDDRPPAILLTGHATINIAVQAIKLGAEQFLTKPVDLPALGVLVSRSLNASSEQRRATADRRTLERAQVPEPFAGVSEAMARVRETALAVASADATVLLNGETGTGKGVLARWLHQQGKRASEAFTDLNCAGLSRELAESELFGHQRGSFTGAVSTKRGLLELAHHGTLFLDEIGDLDLSVQPKLLKVLEEKSYRRVGDVATRAVDVRLISATHRELGALVKSGGFRSDLLFRLNTVTIELPPLRKRREDLPALVQAILAQLCAQQGRPIPELSKDALGALQRHTWPGNIRELRNVIERALLFTPQGAIQPRAIAFGSTPASAPEPSDVMVTLEELERRHILGVLRETGGRVDEAARVLGIGRSSLYVRLKRYGVASSES